MKKTKKTPPQKQAPGLDLPDPLDLLADYWNGSIFDGPKAPAAPEVTDEEDDDADDDSSDDEEEPKRQAKPLHEKQFRQELFRRLFPRGKSGSKPASATETNRTAAGGKGQGAKENGEPADDPGTPAGT